MTERASKGNAAGITIGKQATVGVFLSTGEIAKEFVMKHEDRRLTIQNASTRTVVMVLASDPDVRIEEEVGGRLHHKVAIEIKDGTDKSNAHNRVGEAEKSHQKRREKPSGTSGRLSLKKGLT